MKISKAELIEMEACQTGLGRFKKQTNDTDESVEVVSLIGGRNINSDLLWLAGKKLTKDEIVKFACECALLVVERLEQYTVEDDYELIVNFLKNPSIGTSVDASYAIRSTARAITKEHTNENNKDRVKTTFDSFTIWSVESALAAQRSSHAAYVALQAKDGANFIRPCNSDNRQKVNDLLVKLFNREYKK